MGGYYQARARRLVYVGFEKETVHSWCSYFEIRDSGIWYMIVLRVGYTRLVTVSCKDRLESFVK